MPLWRTVGLIAVGGTLAAATARPWASEAPGATQRVPQLENDSVRVWKSIIAPGQPLTLHRHEHGRVIVALRGGTLRIAKESGGSRTVNWETGKAYWLDADPPGERHGDQNDGPDPIEVMVVELARDAP